MRGVNPPSVQSAATSRTDPVLFIFFIHICRRKWKKPFYILRLKIPPVVTAVKCCGTSSATLDAPQIFPREM